MATLIRAPTSASLSGVFISTVIVLSSGIPIRDAPPLEDASILHTTHATCFEIDTVVPKVFPEADPPFRLFDLTKECVVDDDEFKVGEGGICYDRMDWEDTVPVLALELSVPDDNVAARGFISREDQPLPRYETATARSRKTRSLSFMFDPVLAAPAPAPLAFLRIVPGGRLDGWYVWQHAHADTIVHWAGPSQVVAGLQLPVTRVER
ncbi:hypothetical protein EI94DRAFT_1700250 [Lactarius quietus]|nr:hypothetical protein EI94DRAFT_1700250 [Lactarius quietus]